jgi:hypothetical protein
VGFSRVDVRPKISVYNFQSLIICVVNCLVHVSVLKCCVLFADIFGHLTLAEKSNDKLGSENLCSGTLVQIWIALGVHMHHYLIYINKLFIFMSSGLFALILNI